MTINGVQKSETPALRGEVKTWAVEGAIKKMFRAVINFFQGNVVEKQPPRELLPEAWRREKLKEEEQPPCEPLPEAWIQELREEEPLLEKLSRVAGDVVEDPQGAATRMVDEVKQLLPSPEAVEEKVEEFLEFKMPEFLPPEEVKKDLQAASNRVAVNQERQAFYKLIGEEKKDNLNMQDRKNITKATQAALQAKTVEKLQKQDSYWTVGQMRDEVAGTAFGRGEEIVPQIEIVRARLIEKIKERGLYTIDELKNKTLEELQALEKSEPVLEKASGFLGAVLDQLTGNIQEAEREVLGPPVPKRQFAEQREGHKRYQGENK